MSIIKSRLKKKSMPMDTETDSDGTGTADPKSLAVALDVQRRTGVKPKKMALGGIVEDPIRSKEYSRNPGTPAPKPDDERLPEDEYMAKEWSKGNPPAPKPDNTRPPMDEYMSQHFAEGGMVDEDDRAMSIADAIMRKRKMMAEGGMVELDNEETASSPYDNMNADAVKKELYDDSQLESQPMDSNEHGDSIDEDAHDMISIIRRKMMAKRGM